MAAMAMVASSRGGSSLPKRYVFTLPWSTGFAFVGSFWASFAIFFDPLGPQKHLLILCLKLVKSKSTKTAQNKQNHA